MRNIFLTVFLFFALSFAANGPVSYYGKLQVKAGTPFMDGVKEGRENIDSVQIRGVSFGWSNTGWESERFYNSAAVERVVKDWKAEVVRAAYGATNRAFSNADAAANRGRIETIIEAAIENDVYVIIDWHSHNAQNETQNAIDFFEYMAEKYGSHAHVIFELYNEPLCSNGANSCAATGRTTWAEIKSYAEAVIPVIRKHSDNLILVGTPDWSQKIQDVIGNAINDINIGYVLHFYAATHSLASFRNNMNNALNAGIPIFITEYGTTTSDGGQPPSSSSSSTGNYNSHNAVRSDEWHAYMDEKKISSAAWNINDKYEGSAFFGIDKEVFDQSAANWSDTTKMTASGKYIFKKLNEYYKNVPWNPDIPVPLAANLAKPAGNEVWEIYSLSGKKMGANLPNGIYILHSRQNGVKQSKILKIFK